MNKLIRKGAGDRVVMINFPATTRNKAGKVVYKPQGATLRDTVPVAVTISKDGNLLFGLMSVTKLHENIQKRSQDRRGKKLYGGNVDLILRDTQAMMDYHKQGLDSIEFFKQKYGAVEADERKKFINTMFGLLNQKEQAVLNPMLLEDGIKSKDNVYRTYRADRVSKAVPMAPEEYAAMPFSYEAVSQVRMPEAQRAMPEGEQGGDVTLTRLREIRDGLDENLTEREAIDELDFIINDAPSGYFPQDILNKVDQAKRDLEEEFTTWAGRGDSEASTESAISSVMSFLDSKESRGEAAPTRFMPEGVDEDKFYSQLDRVITDKVPTRATAQQIMATIDPTRGSGVKADEIKWSGIEQALASLEKDGKVSKEDLLNYLRNEGRVRFEEVTNSRENNAYTMNGEVFTSEAEAKTKRDELVGDDVANIDQQSYGFGWDDATQQWYADDDTIAAINGEYDPRESESGREFFTNDEVFKSIFGKSPEKSYPIEEGDFEDTTKFSQYTLPGGENYREVVLAMPNEGLGVYDAKTGEPIKTGFKTFTEASKYISTNKLDANITPLQSDYTSSHFPDIPNYVAHMRTNERTLDDGSEGDFVEEFQSDRHQEGRKKGYKEDTSPEDIEVAKKVKEDAEEKLQLREYAIREENGFPLSLKEIIASGRKVEYDSIRDADAVRTELKAAVEQARQRYATLTSDGQVADAPFRTTWPIQLFKRALRNAVDGGKDWIGWTTGETQNERFDLSKQIGKVVWNEDTKMLTAYDPSQQRTVLQESNVTPDKLSDYVGKEVAQKLVDQSPDEDMDRSLSGLDLKVGGEGMKGFYDNMLPKEVGKYVKQWGGKVEKAAIADVSDLKKYVETYDAWREYVDPDGYTSEAEFDAMSEAEKLAAVPRDGTTPSTPIWKVNITPEMRKISQTGQMRFMPEGDVKSKMDNMLANPPEVPKDLQEAWDIGAKTQGLSDIEAVYSGQVPDWVFNSGNDVNQFYEAGRRGENPEYIVGWRRGKIPESGRSKNYADNSMESGVSLAYAHNRTDMETSPMTMIGVSDRKKTYVSGWAFPKSQWGSDGEIVVLAAEEFNPASSDIRYMLEGDKATSAERNTKKPKKKSTAKGDASAIANAAKLK
jgi:hypothetical protein